MIPRIFHQVWVGTAPFPEKFEAFQETWRRHNPEWEFRFWTDENLPEGLRRREAYERLRSPVERCDILRLELLWRFGGVYVDADFECLRPLEPLLGDDLDLFLAYIGPNRPAHGLMGAAPEHPIIERALEEIQPIDHHGYDKTATGPPFFNEIIADYPGLTIFPSRDFYPTSDEERATAYAEHHAERSWQSPDEFRRTIEKLQRRLEKSEAARRRLTAELERRRTPRPLAALRRVARALRA